MINQDYFSGSCSLHHHLEGLTLQTEVPRDYKAEPVPSISMVSLSEHAGNTSPKTPSEELSVSLPSDRDIAIGGQPNVDEYRMYATDVRRREKRVYHPTQEPASPEIQQVFARLLKDALGTLREAVSELA